MNKKYGSQSYSTFQTVDLSVDGSALLIIDQTRLPQHQIILSLTRQKEIWEAIRTLKVRGAPAIGIAAAIGLYLAARGIRAADYAEFCQQLRQAAEYLVSARPTAVNLFWALQRMENCARSAKDKRVPAVCECLRQEALAIRAEDVDVCRRIGEHGLALLQPGDGLLTHCNAGRLATVQYGTATAPMYLGQQQGYGFHIFVDETRPLLQGARLTAFELSEAGLDVTLICDNMAASVMSQGKVQAVFVGCDRVAANGDAANKIGTLGVAVLAQYYKIPFYVCAPSSTLDLAAASGQDIPIEERPAAEVTEMWYQEKMTPSGCQVYNPAFDVTPHELITAIITEYGVVRAPYDKSLAEMGKI